MSLGLKNFDVFLVNLYWDNKYSDSDTDSDLSLTQKELICLNGLHPT